MLGIISGTGFYDIAVLEEREELQVDTPYGLAYMARGRIAGEAAVFLMRHHVDHSVPPHKINYRANIYALKKCGVDRVLAINAVGSLDRDIPLGSIVLIDDFVDFTYGREHSFCDGEQAKLKHVDVSEPYCYDFQSLIKRAATASGIDLVPGGIYVCTQGPRFETRSEIRFYASQGWNIVGMTGTPEVLLAKELGMCYNSLSVVTNYACGVAGEIDHDLITDLMSGNRKKIEKLLLHLNADYPAVRHCHCHSIVEWL